MTARSRSSPSGRAARLWLRRRIDLAESAADRLDQKLRALRAEHAEALRRLTETGAAWEAACEDADRWWMRTALLSADHDASWTWLRADADVDLTRTSRLGVSRPDPRSAVGFTEEARGVLPTAAGHEATTGYRQAVTAALAHGVARAAVAALEREIALTQRRLRGVRERWLPRLRAELDQVESMLDEQDRADGVRLQRLAGEGIPLTAADRLR
jgi:V/A-type H+/Na+-transporting ATPase subunit D